MSSQVSKFSSLIPELVGERCFRLYVKFEGHLNKLGIGVVHNFDESLKRPCIFFFF